MYFVLRVVQARVRLKHLTVCSGPLLVCPTAQVPKGPVQLPPAAAKVPAGQAVVTDTQLPGQVLTYTGECGIHEKLPV